MSNYSVVHVQTPHKNPKYGRADSAATQSSTCTSSLRRSAVALPLPPPLRLPPVSASTQLLARVHDDASGAQPRAQVALARRVAAQARPLRPEHRHEPHAPCRRQPLPHLQRDHRFNNEIGSKYDERRACTRTGGLPLRMLLLQQQQSINRASHIPAQTSGLMKLRWMVQLCFACLTRSSTQQELAYLARCQEEGVASVSTAGLDARHVLGVAQLDCHCPHTIVDPAQRARPRKACSTWSSSCHVDSTLR